MIRYIQHHGTICEPTIQKQYRNLNHCEITICVYKNAGILSVFDTWVSRIIRSGIYRAAVRNFIFSVNNLKYPRDYFGTNR